MNTTFLLASPRLKTLGSLVLSGVLLAACAQSPDSGHYERPRESTLTDARKKVRGTAALGAPSQLQLGFGDRRKEDDKTEAPETEGDADTEEQTGANVIPRQLREARTFLGTIPCFGDSPHCTPQRVTLTVAPTGEWRWRKEAVTASSRQPQAQRGCWDASEGDKLQLWLRGKEDSILAHLEFINDMTLKVKEIDGKRPSLQLQLTRQPDIDPIDEAEAEAALSCTTPA